MTQRLIDLRSDTATRPTPEMRRAMAEAEVGDEQLGEDPTVNRLQAMVAELLGMEAALYLPSGTMCNLIATKLHTRPGDEIILDRLANQYNYEGGGAAAVSGLSIAALSGERGIFSGAQVAGVIRGPSPHSPRSRLVVIENTMNAGGGAVWSLAAIDDVVQVARAHGLKLHMDGARLLNAVVATGIPAATFTAQMDSAWIDLSKGLGCPVGGVLAGTQEDMELARRYKHQLGGAMRQAGIIAAAGVYALEHLVERLAEDHANARLLAEGLAELPGILLDPATIETNIVFFDLDPTGPTAAEVAAALLSRGVRIGAIGGRHRMRAVTHLDISLADVEQAVAAMRAVVAH